MPRPKRPEPESPRARAVVEWAEVVYYVFLLGFSAAVLVVLLLEGGPELVGMVR